MFNALLYNMEFFWNWCLSKDKVEKENKKLVRADNSFSTKEQDQNNLHLRVVKLVNKQLN